MQDAHAVIQQELVMKPRVANYIIASVMSCLMLAFGLGVWARGGPHGWHFLWMVFFVLYIWVGTMLTVAGHRVAVQNGICTVRKIFGSETSFPIADVTQVEFQPGSGRRRPGWDIVIKYGSSSNQTHEIRVNPGFYSREDGQRLLDIFGYKGQTPWGNNTSI